jgi:hypothetical protein
MTAASARPAARLNAANTDGSRIEQDMMLPIEFWNWLSPMSKKRAGAGTRR